MIALGTTELLRPVLTLKWTAIGAAGKVGPFGRLFEVQG